MAVDRTCLPARARPRDAGQSLMRLRLTTNTTAFRVVIRLDFRTNGNNSGDNAACLLKDPHATRSHHSRIRIPMREHTSILVTGAIGFVGSHVTRAARDAGLNIITHARHPMPGINLSADLSDPIAVRNLPLHTISSVIHCAAAIPARSSAFAQDNTRSATVLAEALLDARALRRIIHVSSVAVYRRTTSADWLISEDAEVIDTTDDANDAYAFSKREVEMALDRVAARRQEVSVCHLRASSVYGPGMVGTTLLPTLVSRARNNQALVLRGPRAYRQNFVHVEDVAALAVAMASDAPDRSEPILNAFSDDTYGLFELAELIRAQIGSSSVVVDETEDVDIPVPTFDNRRCKRHHPRFLTLRDNLKVW
jgi:UDP-glucose 4-epimerase